MTIVDALRRGATDLNRSRRMALLFYVAATLPAVIGAAVVMTVPLASLGLSTWPEAMAGNLDLTWIVETVAQSALPVLPILVSVLSVFCLALLLHVYLLGGALQVFATGRPYAMEFFAGCGRNFWRLVRLTLFSLLFFAAAMALHAGLNSAGNKLWGEGNEATPLIYWTWFCYAVLAATLGLCSLAFDYAAVHLVTEDSGKTARAYLGAWRLIWRVPGRTIGLYVTIWLAALLLLGVYLGISQIVPQSSMALVFALFLVRQCATLAKAWIRLWFYSSQCAMYRYLCPPPPPAIQAAASETEPEPESRETPPTLPSEIVEPLPEA